MLARRAYEAPARLAPADLAPVRAAVGDGAVDYVLVLGAFHFVNRIADLLAVPPEAPGAAVLRRVEPARRLLVRLSSLLLGRMDLANRRYPVTWDEALVRLGPRYARATGRAAGDDLAPLRARPAALEILALALAERDEHGSLDRTILRRVHAVVEAALPWRPDDAEGFHARPADPVDAFAFVGTRYASRTTPAMIEALRARGFDDLGILDLATAVADANQWARMWRLLGLPADAFRLAAGDPAR